MAPKQLAIQSSGVHNYDMPGSSSEIIYDISCSTKNPHWQLKSCKSSKIRGYSVSQVLDFVNGVFQSLFISESVPKSPRPIHMNFSPNFWNLPASCFISEAMKGIISFHEVSPP